MKNKCFDIGMIQAFLDGELAFDLSEKLVKHTAVCDKCALAVSEAEEENSLAFSALDSEFNVLVPTERLRTKLFSAIEEIENERRVSWWQRLNANFAFLTDFDLRSPSVVALACTLLFVGTFAFALRFFPNMPGGDVVQVVGGPVEVSSPPTVERLNESSDEAADDENKAPEVENSTDSGAVFVVRRNNRRPKARTLAYRPVRKSPGLKLKSNPKPAKTVPAVEGEDIYLSTISTLNNNVNRSKDMVMRPKERIAFERNLAMVNNVITKMKAAVRRNPTNQAAKELLKSSYQNKIDLLNSVSEKNELMASMQ